MMTTRMPPRNLSGQYDPGEFIRDAYDRFAHKLAWTLPPPDDPYAVAMEVARRCWFKLDSLGIASTGPPTLVYGNAVDAPARWWWTDAELPEGRDIPEHEIRFALYSILSDAEYPVGVDDAGRVNTADWKPNRTRIDDVLDALRSILYAHPWSGVW